MRKKLVRQVKFNLGEIDPLLLPRDDNEGMLGACSYLENYMPLLQGSLERRQGLEHCGFIRNKLVKNTINTAMLSVQNGGIAADLLPSETAFLSDTAIGTSTEYSIFELDFGAPTNISVFDIIDFYIIDKSTGGGAVIPPVTGGGGSGTIWDGPGDIWNLQDQYLQNVSANVYFENDNAFDYGVNAATGDEPELYGKLKLQYWQGGQWLDFGFPLSIGQVMRSRRFSVNSGSQVQAQKWRLAIIGTDKGANRVVGIGEIQCFNETNETSDIKMKSFTVSTDDGLYLMVFTEGNIDFFKNGIRCGAAAYGVLSNKLREVDVTQAVDTIIVFHATHVQWAIMRQGTNYDWDFRAKTFLNIPKYDFTGARIGGTNEVQQLRFVNMVAGDIFNITVEDETTGSIVWTGAASGTMAAVKTALETLKVIGTDNITVSAPETSVIEITFQNEAGNDDWAEVLPKIIKSDMGAVLTATITQGDVGGEDKFSASRGYPSCGTFYSQRLWQGGLLSMPETILASMVGDYFNLKTRNARSDGAIDITLDTDEVTAVRRIYPGRSLMIFTSSAEFFWSREPVDATAPAVKNTTKHGILKTAPPVEVDGAVFFVPKSANDILQIVWDDQQQTYTTQSISTLSAHLIENVIDIGFRKRQNFSRPDLLFLTLENGAAVAAAIMRTENMTGFFRITTNGQFLCAYGDDVPNLYVAVNRNGKNRLERFSTGVLDASKIEYSIGLPITTCPNISHLNGMDVRVIIDGEDVGTQTVINGSINLPRSANISLEIGLPFNSEIHAIPLLREGVRSGRASSKVQITGCEIEATSQARSFEAKGSGARWWAVPLRKFDDIAFDGTVINDVKTGFIGRIDGMPGYDQYGILKVRCTNQAAHTINSLIIKGVQ